MNEKEMPCWYCDKECGFIGMTYCEKLNIYLKIKMIDKGSF